MPLGHHTNSKKYNKNKNTVALKRGPLPKNSKPPGQSGSTPLGLTRGWGQPISKFPFARETQKCTNRDFPLLASGPKIGGVGVGWGEWGGSAASVQGPLIHCPELHAVQLRPTPEWLASSEALSDLTQNATKPNHRSRTSHNTNAPFPFWDWIDFQAMF